MRARARGRRIARRRVAGQQRRRSGRTATTRVTSGSYFVLALPVRRVPRRLVLKADQPTVEPPLDGATDGRPIAPAVRVATTRSTARIVNASQQASAHGADSRTSRWRGRASNRDSRSRARAPSRSSRGLGELSRAEDVARPHLRARTRVRELARQVLVRNALADCLGSVTDSGLGEGVRETWTDRPASGRRADRRRLPCRFGRRLCRG